MVLNREDFQIEFQYPASGLNKTIYIADKTIVGGKHSMTRYDSSLLWINTDTGETVTLPDSRFVVYDVVYNSEPEAFFSIGVERTGDSYNTVWKVHYGESYEEQWEVQRFEGEDLNASMIVDAQAQKIYSTLGMTHIQRWDGRKITTLEKSSYIPRSLDLLERKLFALNRNGSLTVWDIGTRRKLLDFFLFRDSSVAGVLANGKYFSSYGADTYVNIFSDNRLANRLKKTYRLTLPTSPIERYRDEYHPYGSDYFPYQ